MPDVEAGDAGAEKAGDVGAETTKPGDAENQKPSGAEGEEGKGGGKPTEVLPENLEDALKVIQDNAGKNEELQKMVVASDKKYEDLSSKIGKQATQIGVLKKIQDLQKNNPKELIAAIAKEGGVKVDFGDTSPDISKVFETEDPTAIEAAIKHSQNQAYAQLKAEFGPQLEAMFQNQLKTQYPDFDDLGQDRDILSGKVLSNEMTHVELLHLAAQGANMPQALEAAKAQGREDYRKELAEKAAGNFPEGGEYTPTIPKKHDENDPEYFTKVVKELGNIT